LCRSPSSPFVLHRWPVHASVPAPVSHLIEAQRLHIACFLRCAPTFAPLSLCPLASLLMTCASRPGLRCLSPHPRSHFVCTGLSLKGVSFCQERVCLSPELTPGHSFFAHLVAPETPDKNKASKTSSKTVSIRQAGVWLHLLILKRCFVCTGACARDTRGK
jgi:hypothetical protein